MFYSVESTAQSWLLGIQSRVDGDRLLDKRAVKEPLWSLVSPDLDELLLATLNLGTGPSIMHQLAELTGRKEQPSEDSHQASARLQAAYGGLQASLDVVSESLKQELQKPGQLESAKQKELFPRLDEVLSQHGRLLASSGEPLQYLAAKGACLNCNTQAQESAAPRASM